MRMPFMLVFHQSKCISAIKRLLFYYRHKCTLVFFQALMCSCVICYYRSSALRVRVKTLYSAIQVILIETGQAPLIFVFSRNKAKTFHHAKLRSCKCTIILTDENPRSYNVNLGKRL